MDIDIEKLISDREAFNAFIYTPLDKAIEELRSRNADESLGARMRDSVAIRIPEPLSDGPKAVLFRQVTTPNYELRRFVSIADAVCGLQPLFWEYRKDKFTSNNDVKKALGKLSFFFGKGKKGGSKIERLNVIDFNSYNGKKIDEVKTLWGQPLVDFHRELFENTYPKLDTAVFYDASDWFATSGGAAKGYYENFLSLFVKHAVLFENFMLDMKEVGFTREIFLPAFLRIMKATGVKPLIVALEPTDIEGEEFWMCHPHTSLDYVKKKLL
ncbi:MAG TPA: hypothetical protein VIR98_01065 [Candidatus Paceibacterota bacterium]|jgi:hypothetical protein